MKLTSRDASKYQKEILEHVQMEIGRELTESEKDILVKTSFKALVKGYVHAGLQDKTHKNFFTGDTLRNIKGEEIIFDELKIINESYRGNGNTYRVISCTGEDECFVYKGEADDVANYLNGYFDIKIILSN